MCAPSTCTATVLSVKMSHTPRGSGFYSRSGSRKRLTASEIAGLAATDGSRRSGFQCTGYQPNESLYSGENRDLSDDHEGDSNGENHVHAFAGSSRYNSLRGQSSQTLRGFHYSEQGNSSADFNITVMLQEQQHLLHKVLDTQKKMQQKQEEFDTKLQELTKRSGSSSSSPDSRGKKKCRITRYLTVSVVDIVLEIRLSFYCLSSFREKLLLYMII